MTAGSFSIYDIPQMELSESVKRINMQMQPDYWYSNEGRYMAEIVEDISVCDLEEEYENWYNSGGYLNDWEGYEYYTVVFTEDTPYDPISTCETPLVRQLATV